MKLIAHRGAHGNKFEENTLHSFLKAIDDDNYVGFEFDIQETKDKKYIINHSPFIKNKLIKSMELSEISNYLLLEDVLNLNTNKIFLIEVKNYYIDFNCLNKILNKSKKNIYIMSFHNNVIKTLEKLNHNYKIGSLNYILNNIHNYNYDFICLLDNINSKKIIKNYLERNIEVFIYGITDINDYKSDDNVYCIY